MAPISSQEGRCAARLLLSCSDPIDGIKSVPTLGQGRVTIAPWRSCEMKVLSGRQMFPKKIPRKIQREVDVLP
jgi:hypothetical protein